MSALLPLGLPPEFIDDLAARARVDPGSIDPSWLPLLSDGLPAAVPPTSVVTDGPLARVHALVNAFRARGHLEATLDPLGMLVRARHPDLDPVSYGFTDEELDRIAVPAGALRASPAATLRETLGRLRSIYCGPLGVEMMHITAPERRLWLQDRLEPPPRDRDDGLLDAETRRHLLERLTAAETFERFIHTKYVGTKRFSIEGGECVIPLLDLALERAGEQGVEEVVLGMAHRGRLNVLANVLGKSAAEIFAEFEDIDPEAVLGGGDVKYHLGYSSDHVTRGGRRLHLSLAFNPSHLEAVDPVVVGRVRAKQRRRGDGEHARVLGVLVHGDAAFAGQGLVFETLNLSQIHGYLTGGTVHVIINNQIGFTTLPHSARSTPYPTDVAKAIQVPIFHVNGDDPDAVARATLLASDYRRVFHSDVVIDLFCYRRYGHNEADEPSFTQPLLYRRIERHPSVRATYAARLVAEGVMDEAEVEALAKRRRAALEVEFARRNDLGRPMPGTLGGVWAGFAGGPDAARPEVDTGVPRETLAAIGRRATTLPDGFHPHPKVARLLAQRRRMAEGEPLDWGMAETLAFGSLLWEGTLVRLSGQDTRRGTFSSRHAAIVDVQTGVECLPLQHLRPGQGEFRIYDSPLSEAAVLGFELGYSLDYPDGLVAWEAQFGDFVNGAQVIIDQFLSSAEDKWKRLSGLTLLLPHGFEGQGPEHSSARFERFLQLSAEDNLAVCQPTTPAQYFHLLRRQVRRPWRKPLVVLTPKSLLRHPEARSTLDELSEGRFARVLPDPAGPAVDASRVLLCSGKVYYELVAERARRGAPVAVVRLEQLTPLADATLAEALARTPRATEIAWVQEEPENMGALAFLRPQLSRVAGGRAVREVARPASASPATGSHEAHLIEQRALMDQAFR